MGRVLRILHGNRLSQMGPAVSDAKVLLADRREHEPGCGSGDGQARRPLDCGRDAAVEKAVADRHLAAHVSLLGRRQDVPRLLPASDVLLLTSISEGIPLTVIEAMAAGRPVVATNVGGVGEIVEDGTTGLLAPPGDDARLAETFCAWPMTRCCGSRWARQAAGERYALLHREPDARGIRETLRGNAAGRLTGVNRALNEVIRFLDFAKSYIFPHPWLGLVLGAVIGAFLVSVRSLRSFGQAWLATLTVAHIGLSLPCTAEHLIKTVQGSDIPRARDADLPARTAVVLLDGDHAENRVRKAYGFTISCNRRLSFCPAGTRTRIET